MNKLYKFYWDCGRMGWLDGLFIADEAEVAAAIGKQVDFGEALGKHSEVYGKLEAHEIKLIPLSDATLAELVDAFGKETLCGRNPIARIRECEEDAL
jgi:hypothetical protein